MTSGRIKIFVTGGTFDKEYNRCFPWQSVRKNRERGVFEDVPRL